MGMLFAEEEGLLFGEASAKSGDGVEGLFMEIGTSLFFPPPPPTPLPLFVSSFFSPASLFVLFFQSGLELVYERRKD